jgi:hypothetical protein
MWQVYDPLLPYFSRMQVQQLVLEYATERAGSVEVLQDLPPLWRLALAYARERGDGLVRRRPTGKSFRQPRCPGITNIDLLLGQGRIAGQAILKDVGKAALDRLYTALKQR